MKLLLTSGGVTNASIRAALVDLLGKPVEECSALAVPTALWGHPRTEPVAADHLLTGRAWGGLTTLPWRSLGVLELTALPTIGPEVWTPWVRDADVILAAGGEATYLGHWMRESGLADLLPTLHHTVWAGVSAGSMVMTPRIGAGFIGWPGASDDRTLGVVDFSIYPHLDVFPENTLDDAREWAAGLGNPAYVLDDQSALVVVDGVVEVVSEGRWTTLG